MERHNGLEQDPEGAFVCHDDAQATIAALQADIKAKDSRIWELESWLQVKSPQEITLMESKIIQLEHQLTQRTAELEAAKAIQAIDMKNNNAYRE